MKFDDDGFTLIWPLRRTIIKLPLLKINIIYCTTITTTTIKIWPVLLLLLCSKKKQWKEDQNVCLYLCFRDQHQRRWKLIIMPMIGASGFNGNDRKKNLFDNFTISANYS